MWDVERLGFFFGGGDWGDGGGVGTDLVLGGWGDGGDGLGGWGVGLMRVMDARESLRWYWGLEGVGEVMKSTYAGKLEEEISVGYIGWMLLFERMVDRTI